MTKSSTRMNRLRGVGDAAAVLDVLRERIATHQLPPGANLREAALSSEFGVSRTRIREVLGALDQLGFVQRIPNRGAVVGVLEYDQVLEAFDIRELLEGLGVRLATEKAPPESWQDLVELFGGPTERLIANGDLEGYITNYEVFRQRVIAAAGSPLLTETIERIYDRTRVVMRRVIILSDRAQRAVAEHQAVLAAMRRGDAVEAERLKRLNIATAREAFVRNHRLVL
jgi:DNA-binding GntR family transcriptional regulator